MVGALWAEDVSLVKDALTSEQAAVGEMGVFCRQLFSLGGVIAALSVMPSLLYARLPTRLPAPPTRLPACLVGCAVKAALECGRDLHTVQLRSPIAEANLTW